jgi:hypothetical protein
MVIMIGHLKIDTDPRHNGSFNSFYMNTVMRLQYLAKYETKEDTPPYIKSYDCSKLSLEEKIMIEQYSHTLLQ